MLNAKIMGISKDIPSRPSHFKELKISKKIQDFRFDLKDSQKLQKTIMKQKK